MFYKVGSMPEKACSLGPSHIYHHPQHASHARYGGMSRRSWDKVIPQITWSYVMKSFKGQNWHLEFDSEADWQSVQLLE